MYVVEEATEKKMEKLLILIYTYTYTYTLIYIYIYIYVCKYTVLKRIPFKTTFRDPSSTSHISS